MDSKPKFWYMGQQFLASRNSPLFHHDTAKALKKSIQAMKNEWGTPVTKSGTKLPLELLHEVARSSQVILRDDFGQNRPRIKYKIYMAYRDGTQDEYLTLSTIDASTVHNCKTYPDISMWAIFNSIRNSIKTTNLVLSGKVEKWDIRSINTMIA